MHPSGTQVRGCCAVASSRHAARRARRGAGLAVALSLVFGLTAASANTGVTPSASNEPAGQSWPSDQAPSAEDPTPLAGPPELSGTSPTGLDEVPESSGGGQAITDAASDLTGTSDAPAGEQAVSPPSQPVGQESPAGPSVSVSSTVAPDAAPVATPASPAPPEDQVAATPTPTQQPASQPDGGASVASPRGRPTRVIGQSRAALDGSAEQVAPPASVPDDQAAPPAAPVSPEPDGTPTSTSGAPQAQPQSQPPTGASGSTPPPQRPLPRSLTAPPSPQDNPAIRARGPVGSMLEPVLEPAADPLSPPLDAITPAVAPLAPVVQAVTAPVIPAVRVVTPALRAVEPLIPVEQAVITPLSPTVHRVVGPLAPVVQTVTTPLVPIVETVTTPLVPIVETVTTPLVPIVETVTVPLAPVAHTVMTMSVGDGLGEASAVTRAVPFARRLAKPSAERADDASTPARALRPWHADWASIDDAVARPVVGPPGGRVVTIAPSSPIAAPTDPARAERIVLPLEIVRDTPRASRGGITSRSPRVPPALQSLDTVAAPGQTKASAAAYGVVERYADATATATASRPAYDGAAQLVGTGTAAAGGSASSGSGLAAAVLPNRLHAGPDHGSSRLLPADAWSPRPRGAKPPVTPD